MVCSRSRIGAKVKRADLPVGACDDMNLKAVIRRLWLPFRCFSFSGIEFNGGSQNAGIGVEKQHLHFPGF